MQFKAGYIVDAIANKIDQHRSDLNPNDADYMNHLGEINGLLRYNSCFDVEFNQYTEPDYERINPVLAVINNIICRGLPTKAPLLIEKTFVNLGLLIDNKKEHEFEFPGSTKELEYSTVFELLHVIEPKLTISQCEYGGSLGSNLEWEFLSKYPFLVQILESQRDFSSINAKMGGGRSVDFCFVSPYQFWDNEIEVYKQFGRIFEVDGVHHELPEYVYYDKYRDIMAHDSLFETIRFTEEAVKDSNIKLEALIGKNQYQHFKKNFERDKESLLEEYTLIFTPLAVARVQKTLIEYFIRNQNALNSSEISIAIVERDLPCGALAVQILTEMVSNLNSILEEQDQFKFPKIILTIFNNTEWVLKNELHLSYQVRDENYFNNTDFDLVLDHSILRRSNVYKENDFQHHKNKTLKVRSSHYYDSTYGSERRIYCANSLSYKGLVEKQDDGSYKSISKLEGNINYFIQNIFRKVGFRDGQLPIISRALQRKPVIGLLPTGGGKSLTYQLPVFLQPGLAIVVDPIKSLMEDQVRVLKDNWIDCCNFINSNLKREEKTKRLLALRYGETQFFFVSPERFVMDDFRQIVNNIDSSKYKLAFSYCVIDEVHCLSEWGHDFRSTYLMIGRNAQKFIKTKKDKVPIIGLTATASFDVLADIEREMEIKHDDVANAIIMIENTIRPELFFRVVKVSNLNRVSDLNVDFEKISKNLSVYNNREVLERSQLHHFEEFEKKDFATLETKYLPDANKIVYAYNPKFLIRDELLQKSHNLLSSIVFCPTKGINVNKLGQYTDKKGVPYVHRFLNSNSKGFFYSTDSDDLNKDVQLHFKNFTSDKTNHMVCTKAFGMGIDKSDIRTTYHYYYSSSLESLVQEAGRAGRDKKIAESVILVSDEKIFQLSKDCLLYEKESENLKVNKIMDSFHRSQIRRLAGQEFYSRDEIEAGINNCINRLTIWVNGHQVPLDDALKAKYKNRLNDFVTERYGDRDIHNFFFDGAFKGPDVENSQFYSLFFDREFVVSDQLKVLNDIYNDEFQTDYIFRYWARGNTKRIYITNLEEEELGFINVSLPLQMPDREEFRSILTFLKEYNNQQDDVYNYISEVAITDLNDGTFAEVFNQSGLGTFEFIITSEKIFPNNFKTIYQWISKIPTQNALLSGYLTSIENRFGQVQSFDQLIINKNGNYIKLLFNWLSYNENFDHKIIEELKAAYAANNALLFLETIYTSQIEKAIKDSRNNFQDFLLILEENLNGLKFDLETDENIIKKIRFLYNRNRKFKPTNDTGRLIYRLFCCGLLVDYKIDYNKNSLYECTFYKAENIDYYLEKIESYLRRYLSEQTAISEMFILREEVKKRETLLSKLLQCLYYLSSFSYKEIASKRRRATDEIESILNKSIQDEKYQDKFEQNKYIKEQIYFYFNAKYARSGYRIHEMDYSLLDDYKNKKLDRIFILQKYLIGVDGRESALIMEGTEQNNYKHMIGSCKKILMSLAETELKNEWLLRIMKAYSMYAVNNLSYINEANDELEKGFLILYAQNISEFKKVKEIIAVFFESLFHSIKEDNENQIKENIQLIHGKILFKIQSTNVDILYNKHKSLLKY